MASSTFVKNLRKKTGSTSFKDSRYSDPTHYINTGSPALNRIISGDINNGIPSGRTIIFAGETGTLKTVQAMRIAANALSENDYDIILYFDSEGGAPVEMIENMGGDPEKIEHILIETVEDASVKILTVYQDLIAEKEKNPNFRALCIVDSLGALVTDKLLRDADKGVLKSEMGGRAKLINSLVKGCTIPALKSDASIIFINHIYQDPSNLFPTKIQLQSGGTGLQYMSSLTLQCTKKLAKAESKDDEEFYSGSTMKFFSVKNRLCRQFIETEVYVDFKDGFGPMRYLGLFEPACTYGFIENPKQGYYKVPSYSDKMLRKSQLLDGDVADEIWNTFIDDFNVKSKADMKYSSVSNATEETKELIDDCLEAADALGVIEKDRDEVLEKMVAKEKKKEK